MSISLKIQRCGGTKSVTSNWTLIAHLNYLRIGKSIRDLSSRLNASFSMRKFKILHQKTRDPGIS